MHRLSSFKSSIKPKAKELRLAFYLLNRNILTRAAVIIVVFLIFVAVFAPVIAPYPGDAFFDNHPENGLQPPSLSHLCGTDELGRDILSRIIYGTRISFEVSLVTVFFAVLLGIILGAVAGTLGGWVDEVIMRITDIFLSFPSILLAISITAILGSSITNAQIAIVVSWWPWYARLMRGQAVSVKEKMFVKAASAIGTSQLRIVFKHVVTNCISPIIISASLDMGAVIIVFASLSFLGLGAQPPTPEWGLMVSTSKNYFMNAWWYAIFPGIAIFITVLSFNLLGDGLREVLDPKTRKIRG